MKSTRMSRAREGISAKVRRANTLIGLAPRTGNYMRAYTSASLAIAEVRGFMLAEDAYRISKLQETPNAQEGNNGKYRRTHRRRRRTNRYIGRVMDV